MESLVLRYCEVFRQISQLTGALVNRVHILGGGARNTRLNQWLADATGVQVIAGPVEATAQGNTLMQLAGLGELHSLGEVRAIARNTPTQVYSPQSAGCAAWDEAERRFNAMASSRVP